MSQLITPTEVIDIAIPERNLDKALIEHNIPLCQIRYIKKALGKTLYNTLVSENDSKTYTGLNETLLLTYVQPILAYYVCYESMKMITAELTSQGFYRKAPLNTTTASESDYVRVSESLKANAELYVQEMREWACDNNIDIGGENISGETLPYIYY